eukprot:16287-Heterococcus_DN1.PRE.1
MSQGGQHHASISAATTSATTIATVHTAVKEMQQQQQQQHCHYHCSTQADASAVYHVATVRVPQHVHTHFTFNVHSSYMKSRSVCAVLTVLLCAMVLISIKFAEQIVQTAGITLTSIKVLTVTVTAKSTANKYTHTL